MSSDASESRELTKVLAKMADLPTFLGVTLASVRDRGVLGDTPLHVAAIWGDIKIGRLILDAGADPNVPGEYGNTPLHEAVRQANREFVKLLLDSGASKKVRNDDGVTPVDLANRSGDPRMQELFHD